MGKLKDVTPKKASVVVAYFKDGLSCRTIAKKLNVGKSSVSRIIKRYQQLGSCSRRVGSGRLRKTSKRDDKLIKRAVVKDPFITSAEIAASLPVNISARSIRRRLVDDFDLRSLKPARKPLLSTLQCKKRVAFCKNHQLWSEDNWKEVLFSDESMFSQFGQKKNRVRRPRNQRYVSRYTCPTVKKSAKVMVWGCFSAHGRGALYFIPQNETVNAVKYKEILNEKLLRSMAIHQCSIFQQDSAPAHTARSVKLWMQQNNIHVLDWPGNSPDLNPIENLWELMKRKVAKRAPSNIPDLMYWIRRVWCTEVTPELCQKLVYSMPRRIESVLKCKGMPTKY